MEVTVGEWRLDVYPSATRRVYQRTSRGSPADCDCTICRNFAALGDAAFPDTFKALVGKLGVDYRKAAEIHEFCDFRRGNLDYGGWFHFYGSILTGPIVAADGSRFDELPWHILDSHFKILFESKRNIAFDEFGGQPIVQLSFYAWEPWVLSEPPSHTQPRPPNNESPAEGVRPCFPVRSIRESNHARR